MPKAQALTNLTVKNLKEPGRYHDGNGLYLNVTKQGSKSWLFRFMIDGKASNMGLGVFPDVSLAEARERAAENRKKARAGTNPIEEKKAKVAAVRAEQGKGVMTFDQCAEKYYAAFSAQWTNEKHRTQWLVSLKKYASPTIGALDVAKVDTDHIIAILEPIWNEKGNSANRVRQRIEKVLDWARVMKYRTGDNPARWDGAIEHLLPALNRTATVRPHPALPFVQVAEFMAAIGQRVGAHARAIEFGILTGARTEEIRGATWGEIDEAQGLWTIPASRMKKRVRPHTVVLSDRARAIIAQMKAIAHSDLVFPGRADKPVGHSTLDATLKKMNRELVAAGGKAWIDTKTGEEITMHGFRSTFSDWARETLTNYDRDLVEIALSHAVGDAVFSAYARGSMIEKRRVLMQAWADYCYPTKKDEK